MDFHALTLSERNIYSGANGLAFLVTFMAVAMLADSASNIGLVLAAAVAAGLWLTAWSLLVYDLVRAGDRWIGPLVFLATLGCLLAALAGSFATLIGAALLLFIFWLPHMAAESAWQASRVRAFFADARRLSPLTQVALAGSFATLIGAALLLFIFWLPHMAAESAWQASRVRAFFADARRLSPLTQVALAAVDLAAFAGTALLMAAAYSDGPDSRRLAAAVALITPGLLVRVVRRARYRPLPEMAAPQEGPARRVFVCRTQT